MSDYVQQQDHNKAVYLRAYSRWTGKMSSAKKRKLKSAGVEHPSVSEIGNRNEKDISEMSISNESPDIPGTLDTMCDCWTELCFKMNERDAEKYIRLQCADIEERLGAKLFSILLEIVKQIERDAIENAVKCCHKLHAKMLENAEQINHSLLVERIGRFFTKESNPVLASLGMAFAVGLDSINGKSMTEIAIARCCTRAAISKSANRACDALQLPRSRYMKSAGARDVYRDRAKQIHRKQKGECR